MTTVEAQSPRYPALYDPNSGVRFRSGRAEVTEEQALQLAELRYVTRIRIAGVPAKDWAKAHRRETGSEPVEESGDTSEDVDVADQTAVVLPPDTTTEQPVDEGRRGTRRSK